LNAGGLRVEGAEARRNFFARVRRGLEESQDRSLGLECGGLAEIEDERLKEKDD
jgi:hypothetical protein